MRLMNPPPTRRSFGSTCRIAIEGGRREKRKFETRQFARPLGDLTTCPARTQELHRPMAQHYIRATRPTDQKAREKFSFTAQLYSYGRDSTLVALPRRTARRAHHCREANPAAPVWAQGGQCVGQATRCAPRGPNGRRTFDRNSEMDAPARGADWRARRHVQRVRRICPEEAMVRRTVLSCCGVSHFSMQKNIGSSWPA